MLLLLLLRLLAGKLLDLLAPPTCSACDARLRRRSVFCAACASTIELADLDPPPGPIPVFARALFGGAVATALRRLKYGDRPDLARQLGSLGRHAAREARIHADLVIPVPLHPARLAERGYNQAALIAAYVARELRLPLEARGLRRTRHTPQQARLDRAARLGNVTGAFQVRSAACVRGRRVVLVDDVATTGATLSACAAALREAGAAEVTAVVVALAARE